MQLKALAFATLLLAGAQSALGQTADTVRPPNESATMEPKTIRETAGRLALANSATATPAVQRAEERDSLLNGVLIGAAIGGAAFGIFGKVLCEALREEGNPPCWRGVLVVTTMGAGIGAAAGAGIDAAFARSGPTVRYTVRF